MSEKGPIDRLKMRGRAPGEPVLHQEWQNLLFLHWPVSPELLRPLIPEPLEIDTFEGKAWIGITPFHLEDVRPPQLPAFPGLSSFHEVNVRTYVLHENVPGIWFLSLDASKLLPMIAARIFFMLPYYRASIRFLQTGESFAFNMRRLGGSGPEFRVSWRVGQPLRDPDTNSLAFFLVERYCAFATDGVNLFQVRIQHAPWALEEAQVEVQRSSLIAAAGLQEPTDEPLAYFGRCVEAEVWAPVEAGAIVRPGIRIHVD